MTLGPHTNFIIAAFAIVSVVVAALILWVIADHRSLRRRLRDMEASGLTRRSSRGDTA